MAKVKVDNRQNRQIDKQTGQKQYAPDHSIQEHFKKCKGQSRPGPLSLLTD